MSGTAINAKLQAAQMWEEVKENIRRLEGCSQHRFYGHLTSLRQKFRCERCGGKMDSLDMKHYIEGWVAAGRKPEEIWPEFHEKSHLPHS